MLTQPLNRIRMSLAGHPAGSLRLMGEARICQLTFSTMTTRCSFMEQADRMRLRQIPLCIILARQLPVHNELLVNILVKAWIYSLIRTSTELLCDILIVVLQDSHLPACLAACVADCLSVCLSLSVWFWLAVLRPVRIYSCVL